LDLTDHVKGRRQYLLRLGAGAQELARADVTIVTRCQVNAAVLPNLKDGGTTVNFESSGKAVVSTGPNLDSARTCIVEGAFGTPEVTLELSTPKQEPAIAVFAAAHVASGIPPQPDVRYSIDYSTDRGRTWQPMVKDWTIARRGQEPEDFWSQSFCYGSAELSNDVSSLRVRFRNNGGKSYLRAELSLVYRTKGQDATKVTFDWTDDAGSHRQAHVFDSRASASRPLQTGRQVRTRWVEFEPVAGK
jgi:hypothetical protein